MFGPIGGLVPGVFPVGVGQLLLKAATRETWHIRHCGVISGEFDGMPLLVQAMPGGAEQVKLEGKHYTSDYVYIRPGYSTMQGRAVAGYARQYIGTPYSFLDYAALTAKAAGLETPKLRAFIRDSGHMICSQLVDQAMADAGWHNFDDGRLPQDVLPAELYRRLMGLDGHFWRPGRADWIPTLQGR